MKARSLFAAAVCAIASSQADVAQAFSISAVTLSPSNVVPPMTELRMTIDIVTPSQGTWLYAPTQISSNATGLHYPTLTKSKQTSLAPGRFFNNSRSIQRAPRS